MPAHSNFAFIEREWPQIYTSCLRAEEYISSDPRSACFYARHSIEQLIERIYQLRGLRDPYRDDLAARVHDQQFREISTQGIVQKLDLIRKVGNKAVHGDQTPRPDVAHHVLRDLHHVLIWAAQHFSTSPDSVPVDAAFDPQLAARRQPMRVDELRKLAVQVQKEQEEHRRQLEESEARSRALEEELVTLRAQVAEAQRTKHVTDTRDYDEAGTRRYFIDADLAEAGWTVTASGDTSSAAQHAESEVRLSNPETGDTLYADYVLWGDDGRPLAVVEAKRTSRNAEAGQEQARIYADALEAKSGQRPLIFYTNGASTWLWDDAAGYPPRLIRGFLHKDELAWRLQSRGRSKPLSETPIDPAIVERDYQTHAIRTVGESFTDRQRAALLVMATGTGKTRTVIALVDQMLRAGWIRRVLFLADRKALVRQAVNAFKEHLPHEPPVNLVEEKDQDARIYVSTYPTMLNRIRDYTEKQNGPFSPGYFDLVIVDEAHRSVYQKYRSIFDWFDSLLLGLTATPVDQVDKNTYLLFQQEPGVPTDAYSLEEAIDDGYLVPPRTLTLGTRFLDRGISYDELSEEEQLEWDALEWDEDGEIPDAVTSAEMNQRLFNTDTVDKVLSELMSHGITVAGGDRLGKTIIFAKNQAHADFIYERFNHQYPMYRGTFARVITHQVEHAQNLIDSFSVPESEPHIAITVDMLDTGIDVPEVVNLLFFKPVYSKTKFWQMVGRGTRTRRELFGPDQDKTEFLILDVCGNVEFFNADLPEREAARPQPLSERLFRHRIDLLTALDSAPMTPDARDGRPTGPSRLPDLGHAVVDGVEYRADHLHADLVHAARHHVLGMNMNNVQVRPHRELVETYSTPEAWQRLDAARAQLVAETLGRLPTSAQRDKEEAKTFDLTVLRAQLAQLVGDTSSFRTQQHRIQDIAANLLTKVNVPTVKAQARLLQELGEDAWWNDASALMLEDVRRRLRDLVVYVDRRTWKPVHTSFTDELVDARQTDLARTTPGTDMGRFKEKAARFLTTHLDTLAMQKLRHNRQLTGQDLLALEDMLVDSGVGSRKDVQAAAEEAQGLGLFIRSLVGLDRHAVQESFNEFIADSTFSSQQLRFIEQIIDYLTANGTMSTGALYESPLSDNGDPDAVLGGDRTDVVVDIIETFRRRATPAEDSPAAPGAEDRIAT